MDLEEEPRKKTQNFTIGDDLSNFSVDELKQLLRVLEEEKSRIEANLDLKSSHKNNAEALFK